MKNQRAIDKVVPGMSQNRFDSLEETVSDLENCHVQIGENQQ